MLSHFSHVWLFATPWAVTSQASPCMKFSRQEYRSGLLFPTPGDLPDPGIKPVSPALQANSLPLNHWESLRDLKLSKSKIQLILPFNFHFLKLDCKESWAPKNWCFWTVVLEKTLESPLDSKEIQPVHPKWNQFYLLEELMLRLKLQSFGHLIWRTESLEKTLILGKIEGREKKKR